MNKKNSLSIVVATYNRARSLEKCLSSLTKQTDKSFSVLIIDGGSSDKTHKVIQKYKKKLSIKVIVDKKPHLAYIRDLGWRKSKSKIIAWIDDDVVVKPQWAKSVVAQLDGSCVGGVTGPTVIPKKLLHRRDIFYCHSKINKQKNLSIDKFFCELYFRLFMQGEKYKIGKIYSSGAWSPGSNFPSSRKLKKPIEVDYLEACNFAVPRKVLEKVGGFDLNYKGTSEWCEVDLAFRIRKAGYRLIFDPKIDVEHRVSSGGVYTRRASPFHRLQNFTRFYLFTYYPKTLSGFLLFILYFQFLIVYYLYLSIKKHFRTLKY